MNYVILVKLYNYILKLYNYADTTDIADIQQNSKTHVHFTEIPSGVA